MIDQWTGHHPLRPIVEGWVGKLESARRFRQPWSDVADECDMFFAGSCGFMFDREYRKKFLTSTSEDDIGYAPPTFRLTVARAFELVALFGPTLYWRTPIRTARSRPLLDLPPDLLQGLGNQQAQILSQFAQQEYMREIPARRVRAHMMERYLNWTPTALRLHNDAEMAITEALVRGRGLLFTQAYQPPGSDQTIVGSFFESNKKVLIDPDATRLEDAWWVALEVTEPHWAIEERYGMPPGYLKRAATYESGNAQGERKGGGSRADLDRAHKENNDLVTYHKIWTRMGAGTQYTNEGWELKKSFSQAAPKYCYLEICEQAPFPLNLDTDWMSNADDPEIQNRMMWPIPFWRMGKWPFSDLSFYVKPGNVWPMPPMAAGLGELKALNIFFSHLVNRLWMSCRDFIAVAKSASDDIRAQLAKGRDLCFLEISHVEGSIDNVVKFLQQPEVNQDVWKIIEALLEMFDRRVGLTELLYGIQGTQSRSATDVKVRENMVSIRPEYMASKVAEWMKEVAKQEALATRWLIKGTDVSDLFGRTGAYLWDNLIVTQPVERTAFEIDYDVDASSGRRRNRDTDQDNLQAFLQTFGPILQGYAQMTGDNGPLNEAMKQFGKHAEMDLTGLMMQPMQQFMQQQQQAAAQQQQAEMQMEQQKMQGELQMKQAELQMEGQFKQQEMGLEVQKLQFEQALEAQKAQQELAQTARMQQLERQEKVAELALKAAEGRQQLQQRGQEGLQQLQLASIKGKQDVELAKQKAKAQPKKPNPKAR